MADYADRAVGTLALAGELLSPLRPLWPFGLALCLPAAFLLVEVLRLRRSGRRAMRLCWRLIHDGGLTGPAVLAEARRLLRPFLESPAPRRREPAHIALLAAARVSDDLAEVQRLLAAIDRAALSPENRRILAEEEVRARLALSQPAQAVAVAESLLVPASPDDGDDDARHRALELLAYAQLCDGRQGAARATLTRLLAAYPAPGPQAVTAHRRAWVLYQLGQLCRQERREGEARAHLREAAALAGPTPVARAARAALHEGAAPQRL